MTEYFCLKPFFIGRFRADMTPLGGDHQLRIELEIVMARKFWLFHVLLLFLEKADVR